MKSKNSKYFNEVEPQKNFPKMENDLLKRWDREKTIVKYLQKNEKSDKKFSFIDGPITANNPMGVHHAWGRTYKDIWQKYANLRGYKQRFQNGFDAQGLWVEVEVEKELGFKNKKEIEEYGVEKFVEKCKERVRKYADIQTKQSIRLGYFMDWDNSYYTMSDENNYMIWRFLKKCHEMNWLYKGEESVPWCPRCETAISQHEILTEDYKEVVHKSVILKFPIKKRDREFLLVWTTTPWTIPANIAIAVDPNLDYVKVEDKEGNNYWLAKGTVKRIFGREEYKDILKGKDLVGMKYEGPFDNLPAVREVADKNRDNFHTVVATDDRLMPISTEEGTGLVHTAVSAGTEDFKLGKKLGLPMIPVIGDDAKYLDGLGEFTGKNAKEKPDLILNYLKEGNSGKSNWIFSIFDYKHRYPVCWRCKEELVWKVADEWYIAMDKGNPTLREKMKKVAGDIKWIPSFGKKRELDWLCNMQDWLISKKNRYWGLALPIWECECGNFVVIGSKEELLEKAVDGIKDFNGKSPHKPQIDKIKIKCPKCGKLCSRIEPVGNPWLDAGIVAYSTIAKNNKGEPLYINNKKEWEEWFPADIISESFPGQFKNWFYSLIAMSTVLEDAKPAKTIFGFATLLDEKGRPMHKSLGNSIEFNKGADTMGADVMRWMFSRQNYVDNLFFGFKFADEVRRRFYLKLWNVYNFFVSYARIDDWTPNKIETKSTNILDLWITSLFNLMHERVTKALDEHDPYIASGYIEEFVGDLSNWYIRRSRQRVGPAANKKDRDSFYNTAYKVIKDLMIISSPFLPFITDEIYTNLTKEKSVHLTDWPLGGKYDKKLIEEMERARIISEMIHSERKSKEIPLKRPLVKATVEIDIPKIDVDGEILNIVMNEVNVYKIDIEKGNNKVILDTATNKKIEEELKMRELIRTIQKERKKMGLELGVKANVYTTWLPEDVKQLEYIKIKTSSEKLEISDKFKLEII